MAYLTHSEMNVLKIMHRKVGPNGQIGIMDLLAEVNAPHDETLRIVASLLQNGMLSALEMAGPRTTYPMAFTEYGERVARNLCEGI